MESEEDDLKLHYVDLPQDREAYYRGEFVTVNVMKPNQEVTYELSPEMEKKYNPIKK